MGGFGVVILATIPRVDRGVMVMLVGSLLASLINSCSLLEAGVVALVIEDRARWEFE